MTDDTHRYELAMEIGEEAVRQGQWQQAMTCFQTALSGLPHEPRVYSGLGDTYLALVDGPRALACYKAAARLAPDIPDYSDKIATLQLQLDLPEEAARSYLMSGDIYWKRERPELARDRWERAAGLMPDRVAPHERLAMYHRRRDDVGHAVRHYLEMATILRRENRCLMALHSCFIALTFEPENQKAWAETEKAWGCVAARDGIGNGQTTHIKPGGLVNAAAEFAQWQLSAKLHQRSMQISEGQQPAYYDLLRQAMIHEGQNQAGLAIQYYERAIVAGLDSPAAYFALSLLYRLMGRQDDAQATLILAGRHPFYARAAELIDR
ncbi:MAG: tetratricopeptide repeat protein [Chloroflexota bacterium]|jgi:tetratricopeptide (TPR) repeat protein